MAVTVPWERVERLPGSTKLGVGASPLRASARFLPHPRLLLPLFNLRLVPAHTMSLGTRLAVCPV